MSGTPVSGTPVSPHRPRRRAARAAAAVLVLAALAGAAAGCTRGRDDTGGQAGAPAGGQQPGTSAAAQTTSPTITLANPPTTPATQPGAVTSSAALPTRSIRIVSPAEGATVGPTFDLRLDVSGFTLVEPNGDTGGTTGHLYVIIDGAAPPPNQLVRPGSGPIRLVGERMTVRDLGPGRHTILVIGANGYTVPFEPPVQATRIVTVRG